jgi:hypothetical protein
MNRLLSIVLSLAFFFPAASALAAEDGMRGMDMPMGPQKSAQPNLEPADGASVRIVLPKSGQVFKGDEVPLEFKMVKGKRGNHVHAYVDGELMGMFQEEKGLLTGIKPGKHKLELRVVAADHMTELKAADKVDFSVR